MANRIISDEDFLAAALELFRTYGFDGVSLKQLADATGLEKASLYYRYPGGKDEIVIAAAREVAKWFQENLIEPLKGGGSTRKRILATAERLREFYFGGSKACVTDVLSLPGGPDKLRTALKGVMEALIQSFTEVARESGLSPSLARSRAEEALVRIEGSLVVARVLRDTSPFERSLKALPELLTKS
ncbi:TetR/AcrR family transcriptional regulator [Terriglobus saanensis]|uniref:Regulatory protein TetR n=1 Tax=Terriglobus saanensis (strain ATCC BAA-1853 / DSM 23119 / SP1PR4) TaxID=401053 RepID=E8V674_TERSS|nr:TetR/AcrR family transcriptional regulator [Terriglobus saanensis]ADV84965.1 regulatory protein TetR [Terriglobus saanensis SP1PR4]